jgi:hypothetical protein
MSPEVLDALVDALIREAEREHDEPDEAAPNG